MKKVRPLDIIMYIIIVLCLTFLLISFFVAINKYVCYLVVFIIGCCLVYLIFRRLKNKLVNRIEWLEKRVKLGNSISYRVKVAGEKSFNEMPLGITIYNSDDYHIEWANNYAKQIFNSTLIEKKFSDFDKEIKKLCIENNVDFLSLKDTLLILPQISALLKNIDTDLFNKVFEHEEDLVEYAGFVDRTIREDAPISAKDGGVIKTGVSSELDYFNDLLTGGEKWLKEFEESEKEKTGCKFLKVGYNKVFGYFIEVSNSNLNLPLTFP